MNSGSVTARFLRTGMPVKLTWQDGRITSVQPVAEAPETEHRWLAPPLVDLQVNGYAGVDFQQDALTSEQLLTAVHALRRDGCSRILYTLITDEWPTMLTRLCRARSLVTANEELRAAIVGWHLEGPFLSPEPGYCGAHDPAKMRDPTPAMMDDLRAAAGGDPVLLTIAPERAGSMESIQHAVALGFKVSLGHTNASATQLRAAAAAGATGFTHLGNACPQQLDRHDNILWRVLDTPGLAVSLIPDTHHVSPALFRLLHRVLKPYQILHTTDAMAAAGAMVGTVAPRGPGAGQSGRESSEVISGLGDTSVPSGAHGVTRPTAEARSDRKGDTPVAQSFSLGKMRLEVSADGIVRQPGKTNFAGSALTPVEGVRRATQMTGKPWQEMWLASSLRPAEFMGWTSEFKVGQPADFCVIQTTADGSLEGLEMVC
jgi:N-acetylglucosamine-6-phosphate deacetylase